MTCCAVLAGMANPMPMFPPEREKIAVLMPMQVAFCIDQGAAGVAGIDRRIGLDEVLEGVDAELIAPERADDARGHRLADAERVADGQHHVSDLQRPGVAEGDGRQLVELDPEHRKVGLGVGAHHLGPAPAAVAQHDLDVIGAFDHVVVGEQITLGRHDHARAQPHLRLVARVAEEEAEPRVFAMRTALRGLAGGDLDDRRRRPLGRGGIAGRWRPRGRTCRRLPDRDGGRHALGPTPQPLGLEGRDDEQGSHGDRDGLGENQPGFAHRMCR